MDQPVTDYIPDPCLGDSMSPTFNIGLFSFHLCVTEIKSDTKAPSPGNLLTSTQEEANRSPHTDSFTLITQSRYNQNSTMQITFPILISTVQALNFVVQFKRDFNAQAFISKYYPQSIIGVQPIEQLGVSEFEIGEFEIGEFKGISGDFNSEMMTDLYNDPNVKAISVDRELVLAEVQEDAPEHLTRLSQRQKLRNNQSMDYVFDPSGGIGVDVYLLDSGIDLKHPEFGHRVHKLADFTSENPREQIDPVGHGTYVAGVIGSQSYGVAKKVNLFDVKVTNKRGRTKLASVVNALNMIVKDSRVTQRPSLVVIPLVMKKNAIMNGAVEAVVNEGIPVVVAAGNDNDSACNFSPSSANGSLTVGALDQQDSIAQFSNWGPCVDIFTSGVKIRTSATENEETLKSGTSLSTGIAAGLVAYYMGMGDTGPQAIERAVKYALPDAIPVTSFCDRPNTTNRVLFNGEGEPTWGPFKDLREQDNSLRTE